MSQKPTVYITDYLTETGIESEILSSAARVVPLQARTEEQIAEGACDAQALLVFHEVTLGPSTLNRLPQCQVIVRCGVGFDNVDLQAAGANGIVVCNVPDYGTEDVADHAMLLLLATVRRLLPCHDYIQQGKWQPLAAFGTPRLRGKTLGLVGCGRIGTATALRAKAFGLQVVFFDPYLYRGYEKAIGIERVDSLEALLKQSDFLSLHCPLTSETYHILNKESLALLPRGAVVINTARGPCIDLDALADALDSEQIYAAGLDVFEPEPLTVERIREHPRVVLTPHIAYYSIEGLAEMRTKAAQEVRRAIEGEAVFNPVNLPWLQSARCKIPDHARGIDHAR